MKNNEKDKLWWADGIIVFAKVSGYIAGPIIIALIIGRHLDNKYNSGNKFFLILITIAFVSTIFLIWEETRKYKKKLDKENEITK